ncbi:MAG: DUF1858 domain-containing protein [Clostridia bacterium]|jgi:hybrid cluster-associated redox disulfide protein
MAQVTKDMTIAEVLRIDRRTAAFFMEMGMHCLGCPSATGESVADACAVHGVDTDELLKKINDFLANN